MNEEQNSERSGKVEIEMKDLNTTKSMDIGDNEKSYETLDS